MFSFDIGDSESCAEERYHYFRLILITDVGNTRKRYYTSLKNDSKFITKPQLTMLKEKANKAFGFKEGEYDWFLENVMYLGYMTDVEWKCGYQHECWGEKDE